MDYKTLTTTLGLGKIAAAIANESTVNLTTMKIGDGAGNPVTPNASQLDLVRVVHTVTINSADTDAGNPNRIIAEAVIPANVGGWTIREVGLYDDDGALIIVANFPDVYKPEASENAARDLLVRIVFEVTNPDVVTINIDTSVTIATRQWVLNNFDIAALLPGGTTYQVLRKKSNIDGDTEWADPTTGNITVDVIEEVQTLAASQVIVDLAICTTQAIAVYIEGVRLRRAQYTINTLSRLTLAQSYSDGTKIIICQNEPAGQFDPLQRLNMLSEIAALGPTQQATARGNLGCGSIATKEDWQATSGVVHFNGWEFSTLSGTYVRVGTTVTVTLTSHGYRVGDKVKLDFTSGTASDADLVVTSVTNANVFVVTHPTSGNTSGNVQIKRNTIHHNRNVRFVDHVGLLSNAAGPYAFIHRIFWNTPMALATYSVVCSASVGGVPPDDDQFAGPRGRDWMTEDWVDIGVRDASWETNTEDAASVCVVAFA